MQIELFGVEIFDHLTVCINKIGLKVMYLIYM